ncbi:precorrin-4 C(11)-methyltransferase [Oscillospiraceae bacterium MB08-C2-2]|nr:precorrin-4 C(11)-methyltransferase [Oscillospiraceae bacterium MB08-C2-2]
MAKVYFVGAGPGAADLITLRGKALLEKADTVIYAGSLVNPALLEYTKPGCRIFNSAKMTLEEVIGQMEEATTRGEECIVRLHTGDPSLYGAIREQMTLLEAKGIPYEVVPGVSSFCGASAALHAEYTLPGISQTLIITRMEGRTPVPEKEALAGLAAHDSSMALFLSAGMLGQVQEQLLAGGRPPETPAAIVYKATWPEEKVFHCTIADLARTAEENGITQTALILVGHFLGDSFGRSRLYAPDFSTGYREAKE